MDASERVRAILSFVNAADRGSFAAAARAIGITPAAVGKNVASLEAALGVRLMNRTTRSLQLTAEGEAFLDRAREAVDALDAAIDAVAAQRAEPVGRVRISTSTAFAQRYVFQLLPALAQRYPALRLELDLEDRRVDLVRDGYDMALRGGVIDDSSLVTRHICQLNTVLAAAPGYLALHGIPKTRADLATHRLIAVRFLNGHRSPWSFSDAAGNIGEHLPDTLGRVGLVVSAPDAAVQGAELGLGIAQVGAHHAWPSLKAGRLKLVLHQAHFSSPREMVLQYPHRALIAPRVRATVDFLLDAFARDEALHVRRETLEQYQAR
ncbi:MAG: LysR family transcriptional regulator [Burkholderiales bacterium]|nr:LysR family transcriptional regulator [Burkholderiales bacterium]